MALWLFHYVAVRTEWTDDKSDIYLRYLVGACLVFLVVIVVRDMWALVMTERIAGAIDRGERGGVDV